MKANLTTDVLTRWRNDIGLWAKEDLGFKADPWQTECFDAMSGFTTDKQRIALKACKGPGKTAMEAVIGLHHLGFFPYSKTACTSITGDNLRDNLWAEFKKWMRRSSYLTNHFTWTKERIMSNTSPEEWWISARKWSKDADPEQQANTLAGLHADYILFILDEAGGIPDSVAAAAEGGLATGKRCRLLIGGNATHTSGPLYRACTSERAMWWVKEISGDPEDPNRAPRVSIKWAREQIRKYGRHSAYVMVNVLGQFPKGAVDSIISYQDLEDAYLRWNSPAFPTPRVLGADIARYGTDLTAICHRHGQRLTHFDEWQGLSIVATSNRIHEIYLEGDYGEVRIDDAGVGGGVTDILSTRQDIYVTPINVGESPIDNPDEHVNLRSELFYDFQQVFARGEIAVNPLVREETSFPAEGTTLKIEFNDRNKRRIEPKDKYRKRTGRSPNYLDAAMLAWADRAAMQSTGGGGQSRALTRGRYNPYKPKERAIPRNKIFDRRR